MLSLACAPALSAVLTAIDQRLLALDADRQYNARVGRANREHGHTVGWKRQFTPCGTAIRTFTQPTLATSIHRLMRGRIDREREYGRRGVRDRAPRAASIATPQHTLAEAASIQCLWVAARC